MSSSLGHAAVSPALDRGTRSLSLTLWWLRYPVEGYLPLQDPPTADLLKAHKLLGYIKNVMSTAIDTQVISLALSLALGLAVRIALSLALSGCEATLASQWCLAAGGQAAGERLRPLEAPW